MNEFEKEYYEADDFWSGNMVQDDANKKRIELTSEFVLPDVKSLVDVGCGNGVFLNYIKSKRSSLKLLGIERSKTALQYVNTDTLNASIDNIQLESRSFDCVTCLEVLEHLPCDIYEKSLDELARLSKKYIIISVPYNEVLEDSYNKCPKCRTIFNCELHLRSYDDNDLKKLFASRDFECVRTVTTGTGVQFKGHGLFSKVFYPENFHRWRSPICPVCGFKVKDKESNVKSDVVLNDKPSRKLISYFTFLPKLFWPKERNDYWIIAFYKRKGGE